MKNNNDPYDQPSKTAAIDGQVVLSGPDGGGVSLTPQAAETTGQRLIKAAKVARGQLERMRADMSAGKRTSPSA